MLLFISSLFFLLNFSKTNAQTQGRFLNPPDFSSTALDILDQPAYKVGDVLRVSWTSNAPGAAFDLVLKQFRSPLVQKPQTPNAEGILADSYSWKVFIDGSDGGGKFNLLASNQFNFELYGKKKSGMIAQSAFFNISNDMVNQRGEVIVGTTKVTLPVGGVFTLPGDGSGTTTVSGVIGITSVVVTASSVSNGNRGLSTQTIRTGTILDTSSTAGTALPTSTSTNFPNPPTMATKSSIGTTIGIGAGAGVGGAAVVGLAIWWFCNRRKKSRRNEPIIRIGRVIPESQHSKSPMFEHFSPGLNESFVGQGLGGDRLFPTPPLPDLPCYGRYELPG